MVVPNAPGNNTSPHESPHTKNTAGSVVAQPQVVNAPVHVQPNQSYAVPANGISPITQQIATVSHVVYSTISFFSLLFLK